LVIATLNFAEFCVAEFDIYCTSKQSAKPTLFNYMYLQTRNAYKNSRAYITYVF